MSPRRCRTGRPTTSRSSLLAGTCLCRRWAPASCIRSWTSCRTNKLRSIVEDALAFQIPLVEVEPGVHALELFHGPTLAFKDVGARVMARLMAALFQGDNPLTILVATSGDTGSAVAHAFHEVPHTRVAILYPRGRISPTQEAQLTMFNGVKRRTSVPTR